MVGENTVLNWVVMSTWQSHRGLSLCLVGDIAAFLRKVCKKYQCWEVIDGQRLLYAKKQNF